MKRSIERIVKLYAGREYRLRGDKFATLAELKAICCDPLAWLDLLRGEDALDLLLWLSTPEAARYASHWRMPR